jgi:hypothetical protein
MKLSRASHVNRQTAAANVGHLAVFNYPIVKLRRYLAAAASADMFSMM